MIRSLTLASTVVIMSAALAACGAQTTNADRGAGSGIKLLGTECVALANDRLAALVDLSTAVAIVHSAESPFESSNVLMASLGDGRTPAWVRLRSGEVVALNDDAAHLTPHKRGPEGDIPSLLRNEAIVSTLQACVRKPKD